MDSSSPTVDFLLKEGLLALKEEDSLFSDKRWRNEEKLAEGGFKSIYTVYDSWNHRVVVKARPKNESDYSSFINEFQLLSSLQHPYILPVYDIGKDDGVPYCVMKFIEGQTLSEYLENSKLQSDVLINMFHKLCEAVFYAHNEGIVHLDLKPDNIRISQSGDLTLCDWGSARGVHQKARVEVSATPAYMAPEMFKGIIGVQSDIYALGIIFYEILSAYNPFYNKDLKKTVAANKQGEVDFSQIRDLSSRAICHKALEFDAQARYENVADILIDLRLAGQGQATKAEKAGRCRKTYLLCRRNPQTLLVVLLLLALLVISSVIFAFNLNREKKAVEVLSEKHREERDLRIDLSVTQAGILLDQAWIAFGQFRHIEASNLLKLSLHKQTSESGQLLKGILAIIAFDPIVAKQAFDSIETVQASRYRQYLEIIPKFTKLLNQDSQDWVTLIMDLRKIDIYFYHHFTGYLMNSTALSEEKKELFINQLYYALTGESILIQFNENENLLKFSGSIRELKLHPFKSLRIKKLDFSTSQGDIKSYTLKNLHFFHELEEVYFHNTKFDNFLELQGLPINILSISCYGRSHYLQQLGFEEIWLTGREIQDLHPLLKCVNLRKVKLEAHMVNLPGYEAVSKVFICEITE
ncbi:serine/threonine-protein kinase [Lentisphaera profundi]|uniref:Serine/threonine-protein kinase n=1 Tax=Lentisphaera profundi TaxID=1658616 RepID=A0ABY7VT71_9BACT|nr:serine/threonine-protein kinase [Lentisphaera profundi]WDE96922.1 serine/threonine-protein kinase [Lentisphaera profundi]